MKNDDESDNGTTKSPSVTVAQNPTKKDQKRNIFNEKPQSLAGMKKSLETWKLKKRTKCATISSGI